MEELIPIVAIFCLFGLPIIGWIIGNMLKHQREMAQLVHGIDKRKPLENQELQDLRKELAELKEIVLSHSISMDTNMDALRQRMQSVEIKSQDIGSR